MVVKARAIMDYSSHIYKFWLFQSINCGEKEKCQNTFSAILRQKNRCPNHFVHVGVTPLLKISEPISENSIPYTNFIQNPNI